MIGREAKRATSAAACVAMLALGGCGGSSPHHSTGATSNISADAGTSASPNAGHAGSRRRHPGHRYSKKHRAKHSKQHSASRGTVIHSKRPSPVGPPAIGSASAGAPVVSGRALQQASLAAGTGGAIGKKVASAPKSSPFIRAADAVCRAYRQQVRPLGQASTLAAQEQIYPTLVADARAAVTKLQTIKAPSGDASAFSVFITNTNDAINAFVAAQDRTTSTVESQGTAMEEQDFHSYQTAIDDATTAGNAARALGFRVCGSPGSEWL